MKRTLLTLCSSFTVLTSFAQSAYLPFEEATIWRVDHSTSISSPALTCTGTSHAHVYLSGDTTILSKNYKKVYRSDIFESDFTGQANCYPYPEYATSGYVGALYDDPLTNRAYFVPYSSPDTTDLVLYDYNLVVGDTIVSSMVLCDQVVTAIDTVTIAGVDRIRWHYLRCDGNNAYYIQGLGSSHGLIEPTGFAYLTSDLICIEQNESLIYSTGIPSEFGCFPVYVGISKQEIAEIILFPNPAKDVLTLSLPKNAQQYQFTIYNQVGQLKKVPFEASNGQYVLNTSFLANGVYFLQLTIEEKTITKRFIVNR